MMQRVNRVMGMLLILERFQIADGYLEEYCIRIQNDKYLSSCLLELRALPEWLNVLSGKGLLLLYRQPSLCNVGSSCQLSLPRVSENFGER